MYRFNLFAGLACAADGFALFASATWLGLALLGWGASKFSSLATGSETVYCRLNTLPIAMSLMVSNRSARALSPSRRNLLMRSLRLFGVLYTYVGFVRPWDGCLPRALAPAVPLDCVEGGSP